MASGVIQARLNASRLPSAASLTLNERSTHEHDITNGYVVAMPFDAEFDVQS